MNIQRAEALEATLRGNSVGTWMVHKLIDCGKSAAVFRAASGSSECALKIFDPDLVGRYGRLTQLDRIEREVSLAGHEHPNLVNIYEGGECERTGHLYVAMERIDAPSLKTIIPKLPRERIRPIIKEVASAARFLEDLGHAHRDIKPANIVVSDDKATLLDLGVLRAISHPSETDNANGKPFVGTLQYSPPEFLLRKEEDSLDGWRAVTFYQLGAVLYDMIERKTIFYDFVEPYARMVNAVQGEMPKFVADDVPKDLIHLAEMCLLKQPDARLELVAWDDFEREPFAETPAVAARRTLSARRNATSAQKPPSDQTVETKFTLQELAQKLQSIIRNELVAESNLPPVVIHEIRQRTKDAKFTVSFAPNPPLALEANFAIEFMIELVEPAVKAFRLRASAWVSKNEIDPQASRHQHIDVYAGLVHQEAIVQAVQDFVLPTFVEAQDVQGTMGEGELPIGSSEAQMRGNAK